MTIRLPVIVVVLVVVLAGCSGLTDDGSSESVEVNGIEDPDTNDSDTDDSDSTPSTEQEESGPAIEDEAKQAIYESVTASLDDEDAAAFEAAVLDNGEPTANGNELLDRLIEVDDLGAEQRDAVARSIASAETVDDDALTALDRTLDSPESHQHEVLAHGITDTSGDELLDGEAVAFGLDPEREYPERSELAAPLAEDGYDERDIEYLEAVVDFPNLHWEMHEGTSPEDELDTYSEWAQAAELGLLHETVANGTVTDEDLWAISDESGNGLINAMEVEFGSDPSKVDSSGDGFSDGIQWGPMQDLGLDVNPTEPDIYIELDSTTGVDAPDDRQLAEIQSTFEEEPPDEIGPINLHFHECSTDVEPVSAVGDPLTEEMESIGFHYLLINDGSIESRDGDEIDGYHADTNMVADGTQSREMVSIVVTHEIGHTLGIHPDDFDGVDSHEYSRTEYNSVMNYNAPNELTFSTEEPFNDYEHMADQQFGSDNIRTYQLEEYWRGAWADPDVLC